MPKLYDVVAVTGTFKTSGGQTKNRYQNLGAVLETQGGLMLKLEALPIGWDGWAYLNNPRPADSLPGKPGAKAVPARYTKPGSAAGHGSAAPEAGWPEDDSPWNEARS